MSARTENPLISAISSCKALHILPRDNVASSVISPAMAASDEVDIMMGFFSSASFAQIAPGLATFLGKSTQTLRLVISPFISPQDQEAFRTGILESDALASRAVDSLLLTEDDLAKHTLKCLAWLISTGRLEVRIALMRDALFHSKVWIFGNNDVNAALHGSANMTGHGLGRNREQLSLARSWKSSEGQETCTELAVEFEAL
jgi:HKD family nuclease